MCSGRHLRLRALAALPVRLENRAGGCLPLVPAAARHRGGRASAGPRPAPVAVGGDRRGRRAPWPPRRRWGWLPVRGPGAAAGTAVQDGGVRGLRVRGLWAAWPPLRSAAAGRAGRRGRRAPGCPLGAAASGVRAGERPGVPWGRLRQACGPEGGWASRGWLGVPWGGWASRGGGWASRGGGCVRHAGRRVPGRPRGVAAGRGVGRRIRRGPGRVEPRPSSAARASCCAAGSGRAARHVLRPDRPARGRRPVRGHPSTRAARRPGRGRRPAQVPPPRPVPAPRAARPTPRAEARLRGRAGGSGAGGPRP